MTFQFEGDVVSELYNRYRPKAYKHVVGQEQAVSILSSLKATPHAILFHGPSGVGKTTLARILRAKLDCHDVDFIEMNCASKRGVDDIRDLELKMSLSPMSGSSRVFLLDEAHRLTSDAQSALLKMLEDCPRRAYFMLATTDVQKLLSTIRTRCTSIPLVTVNDEDMRAAIRRVSKAEKLTISESVEDKILEIADGSVRRAIVTLESVAGLKTEDEQLQAIEKADEKRLAIDLCRMLMGHTKGKADWKTIASHIKAIPESELESFRRMVLSYANSCMIGGKEKSPPAKPNQRAYAVIVAFSDNWFDSGRAGLTAACCEVLFAD
jgi:DNA polymerase III gamma/tau subunit